MPEYKGHRTDAVSDYQDNKYIPFKGIILLFWLVL